MLTNLHFSNSLINLILCLPLGVKTYSTPGGFSGSSRFTKPKSSSSLSLRARVRLTIFGFREARRSLNLFGPFSSSTRISFVPFLPKISSKAFHIVTFSIPETFKCLAVTYSHLVTKGILGDIMTKLGLNKYPELIEYYRKKGYRVETDADLRDAHAWIPSQLYVKLMTKASATYSQRGRISKAIAEAVERWIKDDEDG